MVVSWMFGRGRSLRTCMSRASILTCKVLVANSVSWMEARVVRRFRSLNKRSSSLRLLNRWTPPAGTSSWKLKWGGELVFPVVFGRTTQAGDEEEDRTHFGLWCVHQKTGIERFIEAPFFLECSYDDRWGYGNQSWDKRWMFRGKFDGQLMLSLSKHQSYDIAYWIFLFDGTQWTQATREERYVRLLTLGCDHDLKVWDEPGGVAHPPILEGGEVVRAEDPVRLAVDYTHAFSYDSGPETPNSPEYLALCEENRTKGSRGSRFRSCSAEELEAVKALLPAEYEQYVESIRWPYDLYKAGGHIWLTISVRGEGGFVQLLRFG